MRHELVENYFFKDLKQEWKIRNWTVDFQKVFVERVFLMNIMMVFIHSFFCMSIYFFVCVLVGLVSVLSWVWDVYGCCYCFRF